MPNEPCGDLVCVDRAELEELRKKAAAYDEAQATLTPVPEWLLRLPPIEPLPNEPAEVKPGQVWLAKDVPGALLLVVEKLEVSEGYACCPIAEETAYLSDKDIWLDKGATRFGKPMMVQAWLDVPTTRAGLAVYIGELSPETLQRVLRFRAGVPTEGDKHMSGPPLTGKDDPRYEWQQQQVDFWRPASVRLTQRILDAQEIAELKAERDHERRKVEAAIEELRYRPCPEREKARTRACEDAKYAHLKSYDALCPKCWSDYLDQKAKEARKDA